LTSRRNLKKWGQPPFPSKRGQSPTIQRIGEFAHD
jgi:hypothetical protein